MNQDRVIHEGVEYVFVPSHYCSCDGCACDTELALCLINKNFECMRSWRDDKRDGYFKKVEPCTK